MNSFSVANYNSGLVLAGPEIFLGLAACVILMLDLMLKDAQRHWSGVLAVVALLVTAVLTVMLPVHAKVVALGGMFEVDRRAQVLKVVTLLTVTVVFVDGGGASTNWMVGGGTISTAPAPACLRAFCTASCAIRNR